MMKKRAVFAVILMVFSLFSCSKRPVYPEPKITGGEVEVSLDALKPGAPSFYTHHYGGKKISFFVIKYSEKSVESYFDACMRCYPEKLGYRHEGGDMVCRACNMKYPVTGLSHGFGSCYPIKLNGLLEGGKYRIAVSDIEKMAPKF